MKIIWHKTEPIFHIILCWTNFLIQMPSFFEHRETFNHKNINAFIAGCERRSCTGTWTLRFSGTWTLRFLVTPARTTDETCLESMQRRNQDLYFFLTLLTLSKVVCVCVCGGRGALHFSLLLCKIAYELKSRSWWNYSNSWCLKSFQ